MSEWQKIETAPKDGTRILLGWHDGHIELGLWRTDAAMWMGEASGFWRTKKDWPTCWQPLPELEQEGASEALGEPKASEPQSDSAGAGDGALDARTLEAAARLFTHGEWSADAIRSAIRSLTQEGGR